jgi:hypothetical protein
MVLPGRRPVTVLILTAAAAASGILATPAATHTVKPACSSARAHPHGVQPCDRVRDGKTARPHAKPSKRSGRHAKGTKHVHDKKAKHHKVKRTAKKGVHKATRKTTHKAAARPARAMCEDGSAPVHRGPDSFTCGDGSEPGCEDGSFPIVASNGKTLVCNVPSNKGSSGGGAGTTTTQTEEAICEDGSSPFVQNGSFACDDGSEPYCEEGSYPTASSDGTTLECVSEEAEE